MCLPVHVCSYINNVVLQQVMYLMWGDAMHWSLLATIITCISYKQNDIFYTVVSIILTCLISHFVLTNSFVYMLYQQCCMYLKRRFTYHFLQLLSLVSFIKTIIGKIHLQRSFPQFWPVVCVKLLCRFCSVHCHYTKASSLPQIYSVPLRASLPVYVLRAPPTKGMWVTPLCISCAKC